MILIREGLKVYIVSEEQEENYRNGQEADKYSRNVNRSVRLGDLINMCRSHCKRPVNGPNRGPG